MSFCANLKIDENVVANDNKHHEEGDAGDNNERYDNQTDRDCGGVGVDAGDSKDGDRNDGGQRHRWDEDESTTMRQWRGS
jgi:hypothetical protein